MFKFKIVGTNKRQVESICQAYSYFKTDEDIESELDIIFSDFTPDNNDCDIINQKYYVKENYIFCNDRYKMIRWSICIKNIDHKPTVYFKGGMFSEVFLKDSIVEPLIAFKLAQKGHSLLHASSIVISNKGFMFVGGPGTGKTSITLNQIKNDVAFLSDEMSILSKNGMMYNFPLPIRVYNHNLMYNSYFSEKMNLADIFKIRLKYFVYLLSFKYIKLPHQINTEQLFDRIEEKWAINSLILLSRSSRNKIKVISDIDKKDFIQRLILVNRYQFKHFSEYLFAYSSCYPKSETAFYWQILDTNLLESIDKACCYEIKIPFKYDYNQFNKLDEILE